MRFIRLYGGPLTPHNVIHGKQGDQCEFLHEYNLRKMPECYWLSKYGYCSAGDECLYYHPLEKKRICEDYKRGFCWLGGSFESFVVAFDLSAVY